MTDKYYHARCLNTEKSLEHLINLLQDIDKHDEFYNSKKEMIWNLADKIYALMGKIRREYS